MKKSMPNAGIYDMIYYGQDRWCNKHADYDAAYDATTIRYCINYWSKEFTIGYLEMFEWYEQFLCHNKEVSLSDHNRR